MMLAITLFLSFLLSPCVTARNGTVESYYEPLPVIITPETVEAERIKVFTSQIGEQMFIYSNASAQNVAFSPFLLYSSLLLMHKYASNRVKMEITDALGLWQFGNTSIYKALTNLSQFTPCAPRNEFSMSYRHYLLYDEGLGLEERASHQESEIGTTDFTNKDTAKYEINKWFGRAPPKRDFVYLDTPLLDDTRTMFMNALRYPDLSSLGYKRIPDQDFFNFNDDHLKCRFMEKKGTFYNYNGAGDVQMFREDLPGGRYSILIMVPRSKEGSYQESTETLFDPSYFSSYIKLGLGEQRAQNITLKLPHLSLESRLDMRESLQNLCISSLFTQRNPMDKMFMDTFYMPEFRHSESINFNLTGDGENPTDNTRSITGPMWFMIVDSINELPLTGALYLGYNGTDCYFEN